MATNPDVAIGAVFCRIFDSARHHTRMDIPNEWMLLYGAQIPSECELEMANGAKWGVGLRRCPGQCYFERDWAAFVAATRLETNDVVLFVHKGGAIFTVWRFNDNGCMPRRDVSEVGYHGHRLYRDPNTSSDSSDEEWLKTQEGDFSTIPSFTMQLTASHLESSLPLPDIWWKTHIEDKDSVQAVTLWVGDVAWPVYVQIKRGNVKMTHGWKRFVEGNQLHLGTLCKFELLPGTETTFRVVFERY